MSDALSDFLELFDSIVASSASTSQKMIAIAHAEQMARKGKGYNFPRVRALSAASVSEGTYQRSLPAVRALLGIDQQKDAPLPSLPGAYKKKPIPYALKVKVQRRDGFRCQHCGSEDDLCVDHILPERRGGKTVLENLQTLCRVCNSRKGTR